MARIPLFILLVAVLASCASATVPMFCKCTCFQNSTIIPLGPESQNPQPVPERPPPSSSPSTASAPPPSSSSSEEAAETDQPPPSTPNPRRYHARISTNPQQALELAPREASTSCRDCNRALCQRYNLPICKGAEEKDIFAECFHRDSAKDQVVVWGFILGTAGLLGWAGVRRVVDGRRDRAERLQRLSSGRGLGRGQRQTVVVGGSSRAGELVVGGDDDAGEDDADGGRGGGPWRRASAGGGRGDYSPLVGDGAGAVRAPG